ncbi:unnamed protein product [Acanthosepion pharaonis]|uniref:Uncharacterized protein n=1 Tax=Acanthosepion pharaonis TaxID=158019 RepID=A0A812E317_ACAPH|nr:unnamed protein product [Sepia pharaonis]
MASKLSRHYFANTFFNSFLITLFLPSFLLHFPTTSHTLFLLFPYHNYSFFPLSFPTFFSLPFSRPVTISPTSFFLPSLQLCSFLFLLSSCFIIFRFVLSLLSPFFSFDFFFFLFLLFILPFFFLFLSFFLSFCPLLYSPHFFLFYSLHYFLPLLPYFSLSFFSLPFPFFFFLSYFSSLLSPSSSFFIHGATFLLSFTFFEVPSFLSPSPTFLFDSLLFLPYFIHSFFLSFFLSFFYFPLFCWLLYKKHVSIKCLVYLIMLSSPWLIYVY